MVIKIHVCALDIVLDFFKCKLCLIIKGMYLRFYRMIFQKVSIYQFIKSVYLIYE